MKNNKGFSLVELIVVIAIMAILAAVAVVSFSIYIEKAHESNDNQYLSNLKYFAMLSATEHQYELVRVEVAQVVDGPEDIKLWVIDPETKEPVLYTYGSGNDVLDKMILEIYQGVGDWTFHNLVDEEEGETEEEILPDPIIRPDECSHSNTKVQVLQAPTCDRAGLERTKCIDCHYVVGQ